MTIGRTLYFKQYFRQDCQFSSSLAPHSPLRIQILSAALPHRNAGMLRNR